MSLAVLAKIYQLPGPQRVEQLNSGVRATVFRDLAMMTDLPMAALADALGLSPRTMRNRLVRAHSRLNADETERSFRVYRVLRRATEVLGNAEAARSWLSTPQKALGDRTPVSMLVRDVGTEEVLNSLTAIEHGVFQ